MALVQYGTKLAHGEGTLPFALPNASNYIVESYTVDGTVDQEITNDADGAPYEIAVYNQFQTVKLTLLCKAAAAPLTDFPTGTMIATTWFIDSAPVTKTKSPHRVELSVTNIGIS